MIELLVVISITALLIGILVPGLGKAHLAAKTARELAASQQVMLGYTLYADDHAGVLLPGYPPEAWVTDGGAVGTPRLTVEDESGNPVTSTPARRYPWRLAPYLGGNFGALYKDPRILNQYKALGTDQYHYLVSLSPSFGLNSTFLGGDSDRNGFKASALRAYGAFYLIRLDQAQRPAGLVVLSSSKGPGLDGATIEGFFRIDAPYLRARQWAAEPSWRDEGALPSSYGFVSYRHAGKAVATHLDAHAEVLTYEQMRDMRRWSDRATGPDWTIEQR